MKQNNNKFLKNKNLNIIFLLLFFIFATTILTSIYSIFDDKREQILNKKFDMFKAKYELATDNYSKLAKLIYYEIVNRDEVLNIFKNAFKATKEEKNILREKLYLELKNTYDKLTLFNLRQFHFHLPNNESFLRFHKPSKFGDNLTGIRYSIEIANSKKKFMQGFEEGRIFNGFRYVFPVFDRKKNHIGSVETSVSFLALKRDVEKYSNSYVNFMIDAEVVDKKVFNSEKSYYIKSDINKEYMYEKKAIDEFDNKFFSKELIENINKSIKDKIRDKIANRESFSISTSINNHSYIVSFLSISNVKKHSGVAYLISYETDDVLTSIKSEYIKAGIIIFTLNILILFFIYTIVNRNRELQEKTIELEESRFELQKKKEKLEVKNIELKTLFDLHKDILIVTNGKRIQNYNRNFLSFFNLTSSEDFYKNNNCICEFFIERNGFIYNTNSNNWLNQVIQNLRNYIESKVLMYDMRRGEERIFRVNCEIFPLVQDSYIVTFSDITESENHKEVLEQKNEFQQELLIQQSKMAEMGNMIGVIIHQWKQPLNAISLISQNLGIKSQRGLISSEVIKKSIDKILKQILFMSETMDNFRNFFKPAKERKNFKIKDSIEDILNILNVEVTKNSISMKFKIENDNLVSYGYSNEFKQVILNIINNAKDAIVKKSMLDGVIEIEVYTQDKKIIIKIRDNAGGIKKDILNKIFEYYFTTKGKDGTGIGLFISQTIIRDMGGDIIVNNILNGVEFIIELPNE